MKRLFGAAGPVLLALLLIALAGGRALAVPTFTNPQVLAVNVGGLETGTDNTQFIFRCTIIGSGTPPRPINFAEVVIDPIDPANPEFGGASVFPMVNKGNNLYVAYVAGSALNGGSNRSPAPGPNASHYWSIVAQEPNTDGVLNNGTGAAPKPASTLRVVPANSTNTVSITPVVRRADGSYIEDKRVNPGQLGNGLRLDPEDSTSANDGSSSYFYTWRVRVNSYGGLPVEFSINRSDPRNEWRDYRYDQAPSGPLGNPFLVNVYNSAIILVLIDPSGNEHYCPMEIDPEAPNGGVTYGTTYTTDTANPNTLLHPTGSAQWETGGVYFRYRMLPDQYLFNWGPLPGEGPYSAFGGPTAPDLLPAIPIGYNVGNTPYWNGPEVIGRPFNNEYTAFAGPDRHTFTGGAPPAYPYYTNTTGRSGQWKYYYMTSVDLRPPARGGFQSNGDISTYPNDIYGRDPGAYNPIRDSDTGLAPTPPGPMTTAYNHPFVTPLLSDGGWSDDLPENGYAAGTGSNAHRSRPTSKTKVRFEVRVTKADNNPLPAQAVRVYIDDQPFTMDPLPGAGNQDYLQGRIFYYDTTFASPNQAGQHRIYFLVDDGVHRAIWPRRDLNAASPLGTGDGRYVDPQSLLAPYGQSDGSAVPFGTNVVAKNYLAEPYVNNRPVLSNPNVTPPSGSDGQPFTYTIVYTDADNDAPVDANVVIDGQAHRMSPDPADANKPYSQGVHYTFTMTLNKTPTGTHDYFFQFRDNWNRWVDYGISPIRREYGEWTTFPAGDDNGTPSFIISGPVITSPHPAELTDAGYFFSDPSQTPATLYDVFVKYKNADNTPPGAVTLYVSSDGGATYDAGTALVPAENSTNYTAGVLYHLQNRIHLAYDNGQSYRFKFLAKTQVQTDNTTVVHVGSGATAMQDGSAHELKPVGGSPTIFADPNNTTTNPDTRLWLNQAGTFYVWVMNGSQPQLLNFGTDYTIDFTNGTVTFAAAPAGKVYATYFYTELVGPTINQNHAPTLAGPTPGKPVNDGTLSAMQGTDTTQFTYSVIYTDADNQPPAYINVVIDTNTTIAMTADPSTPNPPNYRQGVKYNSAPTTLQVGKHSYHFETSDGADTGRLPLSTANPSEYTGPTVTNPGNLKNPTVDPSPKGKSSDLYTFTVLYQNDNDLAPPSGGIELRLTPVGTTSTVTVPLNAIDPIGVGAWKNGVHFQAALSATTTPALVPGTTYSAVFGYASDPNSGTNPVRVTVNARPVISNPRVTPQPASQAGDIAFAITYNDPNGDPPKDSTGASTMKLFIDGTEYTAVQPTTAGADYVVGVVYTWTIPANKLSVGNHTYYFSAADDLEPANPQFVPAQPGGTFTINAAQQPTLTEPGGNAGNNNGTLTPLKGAKSTVYTYSVRYTHGDNVPPVTANLIIDAGTANAKTVAMTPAAGQTQPYNYAAGVTYTYQTQPGELAAGTHTYYFEFADRLVTVDLPTNPTNNKYNGPTVNFPPVLTNPTAFVVGTTPPLPTVNAQNQLTPPVKGNVTTKFVFQTTYADPDYVAGTTPTVTVTINNGTAIALKPKAGDPLNYTQGVVYTTDETGMALAPGTNLFHFDASDGLDSTRLPAAAGSDITGLSVANVATLLPPAPNTPATNNGTIDKTSGPLSTTFTFTIVYQNLDNTAPAFVNLVLDDKTNKQTVAMQKVGTSVNYAAGVTYQAQYRFSGGATHTYRFESQDTVSTTYTAQYPTDGSDLAGPTINIPTFAQATFNPAKPIVGQPVTITSKLSAVGLTATDVAIQLVRPDGTGLTDKATTDAQGNFNYTFTPTQTGDWTIQFSYSGIAGTTDPATATFPFNVSGYTITLPAGTEDMIASPLVPTTPDPTLTFNPTDNTGAALPITVLDLITWIPSGTGTAGAYSSLNTDGNFPGITAGQAYWLKPSKDVVLNPRGKLVDQTQPYSIPLVTGWNMIGSVYLQDINWSAAKVSANGQTLGISAAGAFVRPVAWTYNKTSGGYDIVSLPNGVLSTGRGYWVRALQPCQLVLSPPGSRAAVEGRDAVDRSNSLQVAVRTGDRSDTSNYVPLTNSGNSRLMLMEKPPYLGDYITVRFLDPKTVTLPADSRAAAAGAANVVPFQVETNRKNADVTMQFPNLSTLGRRNEVTLVDLSTGTRSALGTSAGTTFNTGDNTAPRQFALIITSVTANNRLVISGLQATGGNGRSPAVQFSYTISGNASVRAQIVGGAGGTVVRNLDTGRAAPAGANSLTWDGRDNRGMAVPSGSYLLRLTATDDKGHNATAVIPVIVTR